MRDGCVVFVNCIILVSAGSQLLQAFSNGPPIRTTGAPGEQTCAACHSPGDKGKVVITSSSGPSYTPGLKQTLTLTITEPTPDVEGYGFEMSARLESNLANGQAGDFTAGPGQRVLCDDGSLKGPQGCPAAKPVQFIEHSAPSTSNVILVDWTPPAINAGNVHIYVAVVAATMGSFDHNYIAGYILTPVATGPAPAISDGGVVNGASFAQGIQSGAWTSIFGTNLATTTRSWNTQTEIINGVFPTSLDGVSVTIDGKPAAVSFISPTQVNVQAADDASLGPVQVVVTNSNGASNTVTAQLQKYSPGFFRYDPQGGKYIAAQIARSDGGVDTLGPVGLFGSGGEATRPVKPGEIIILYGTGFGPTNPAVPSGHVFSGAAPTVDSVTVTIGGADATVQFAGISGAGLYQLNVVAPALSDGDQKVVATVGGLSSQDNAFITVQN